METSKEFLKKIRSGLESVLLLIKAAFKIFFYGLRWAFFHPKRYNTISLELKGAIPIQKGKTSPFSFWKRTESLSLLDLWELAEELKQDHKVKLVNLKISPLTMGWGRVQELHTLLGQIPNPNRKVTCFLESAGMKEYALANLARTIILVPSGNLHVSGLHSETMFLREALDKLKVEPQINRMGKYKSFAEIFTRKEMSEAHRESIEVILEDIYCQATRAIAEGRGLPEEAVQALIDSGPHLAAEARGKGLVDELLYEDELEKHFETFLKSKPRALSARRYLAVRRCLRKIKHAGKLPTPLAFVEASGNILHRKDESRLPSSGRIYAETMVKELKRVRENQRVKGVLIRVDSPGGSGLASDLIWREVTLINQEKPVFISMGDVAASGGYYISMSADKVFASPGTLTGSIGVIAGKFNLQGLYQRLGIRKEILSRGKFASMDSDYQPYTDEEKAKLDKEIEVFYQDFVKKAAHGRKMSEDEMEPLSQGRVWTGQRARESSLIDQLGGISEVIKALKQRLEIAADDPVALVSFAEKRRFPFKFRWNPLRSMPFMESGIKELETLAEISLVMEQTGPLTLMPPFTRFIPPSQ